MRENYIEELLEKDLKSISKIYPFGDEKEEKNYYIRIQRVVEIICQEYEENNIFLPEFINYLEKCIELLDDVSDDMLDRNRKGTVIIGTVKKDIHDIGKNVIVKLLKAYNYKVIDMGVDVDKECFVIEAERNAADIVCISAMLLNTMNYMHSIVEEFVKEDIRNKYFILVGGACVTREFAVQIGANEYAKSPVDCLRIITEYMRNKTIL